MAKTRVQLDRDIAQVLGRKRSHATVLTAAPYVEALHDAIYRTKDPDALIVAVREAQEHVAAMKRLARKLFRATHPGSKLSGSYMIDASGEFDPKMGDLGNLLVAAKEMVRRTKIQRKTGRFPKATSATAWRTRGI
jgi:hypothetical protein